VTELQPRIATSREAPQIADPRWEKRRAMGRRAFVWRYGVLGWGLPAALLTIAYAFTREQGFSWSADAASSKLRAGIVLTLVLFPALGHTFGARLWEARERERNERRRP
jgi:hypothetical protein